jgi:transketolase
MPPNPEVVLIGTGAEVWPAIDGAKLLAEAGIAARVVSLPSWKIFDEQTAEYRDSILLPGVPKVAIEAGATIGWWKYLTAAKAQSSASTASAPPPPAARPQRTRLHRRQRSRPRQSPAGQVNPTASVECSGM